jgi:glyoxylase-like metal-dependent hydrolase (beta-lactamase superfamily II)
VVCAPGGNVLWDCITLIDDATIDLIRGIGGLKAIAISHPHYYTTMVEWSRAFGGIPVYLHEADRQWVMRSDPVVQFWHGDRRELGNGLTLIHGGGHFAGGTMLHWRRDNGKHVLLSGDILQVVPDRRHVSLMRSYPNLIPLSAAMARAVLQRLDDFDFNSVYGAFWGREILENGRAAVDASIARYVAELERGAEDR